MKENEATEVFHEMITVNHESDGERNKRCSVCNIDADTYSSLRKLLRITVYCLKFIKQRVWTTLSSLTKKAHDDFNKIWICLLTCLSVRAIHLEWVMDLTAAQFLNCLRRFISRRGKPDLIISDNAPQFKLTNTVLNQQWRKVFVDKDVLSYVAVEGIKWNFTTALAPWKGGFYERLVGLVKRCLRKATGRKRFTLEQLATLLTEIEAILNSRPLTYVYEEFESGFVLTPSCFLVMNRKLGLPAIDDKYS